MKKSRIYTFAFALFLNSISLLNAQTASIRLNQLGYYPGAIKTALVINSDASQFEILDSLDNSVVYSGSLTAQKLWADAGDMVRLCDFSGLETTGVYKIRLDNGAESYPFEISSTVWRNAARASLKSYYYQRCSYTLEEAYAGLWARAAGHPDTQVTLHASTGKSGTISSPGGWYDAGDYGKYVVNAGISVGTLLSFHENFSRFFEDGSIKIPESGNGQNDLLDEVKFELDWLKTMQDEDGGVFHKLTTKYFVGFVMPSATTVERFAIGKSTTATLDFAAMMAMAGRIYQDYDSDFANSCIQQAKDAWNWAKAHPAAYFSNPADISTGEYGDGNASDEFIWAAAELYITTGEDEYKNYLEARSNSLRYNNEPGWPNVQPLGALSLATATHGLSEAVITNIRNSLLSTADTWLNEINASAARIPVNGYYWGSNSGMANIGVGLIYAWLVSGDLKYIRAAAECADYILGKNATGFSFMSSYGYKTPMHFHHRPSGADGISQPVPGFVAGGPNSGKQDKQQYPFPQAAKCYVDVEGSYASNEVCINWNSPLTVLLSGVDAVLGDGSEVDFPVPTTVNDPPVLNISSPLYNAKPGSDVPFVIIGSAADKDGIEKIEYYLDSYYAGMSAESNINHELESPSTGDHILTVIAIDRESKTTEVSRPFIFQQVSIIPGKVEAEDYTNMSGVTTAATTDEGGGWYLGSIQDGDYFDISVNVSQAGRYRADFRLASSGGGKLELRKMTQAVMLAMDVEPTGGTLTWNTQSEFLDLAEGKQIIRVLAVKGGWGINWIYFERTGETGIIENKEAGKAGLSVFPNPYKDSFSLQYCLPSTGEAEFILFDTGGRILERKRVENPGRSGSLLWECGKGQFNGMQYMVIMQGGKRAGIMPLVREK